jgi:hypothetical protein
MDNPDIKELALPDPAFPELVKSHPFFPKNVF